jgi:hypothetical protein
MVARIYKPAKTAMQSGRANTKAWVLDFEPEQPREVEPLMGWTSSGDMRQQVRLRFNSKDEAIAASGQGAGPTANIICRQLRLHAPYPLDSLTAPVCACFGPAMTKARVCAVRRGDRLWA